MRQFIALDLPDDVRSSLSRIGQTLDPEGLQARWIPPVSMHLTLKFLGEIGDSGASRLRGQLANIRTRPVEIVLEGLGFFPNRRAPRVFWAGVRSNDLPDLARSVDRAAAGAGFGEERRPFRPHLTLARARGRSTIGPGLVESSEQLSDRRFGAFLAKRFFLYGSHPSPGGVTYEKLVEFEFGAPTGSGQDHRMRGTQ